jgi:hypothetical protein
MLFDQIREWFTGRPAAEKKPEEKPVKVAREKRTAVSGPDEDPKPLLEAAGNVLAAIGELIVSIRAHRAAKEKRHRRPTARRKKRAPAPRKRPSKVPAESARVGPRRAIGPDGDSRAMDRARTHLDTDAVVIMPLPTVRSESGS